MEETQTTTVTTTVAAGSVMTEQWSNSLFGCFGNMGLCVVTFFIPCYTAGKNAERTGDNCLLFGLAYLLPPVNVVTHFITRGKIRKRYGIQGTEIQDVLFAWCCDCCALIQESQELDTREPQLTYLERA